MPNIDERVVEMRFDNKDFEKNVQTSLKTIDKLKKNLDFKDSAKSLDDLQEAAKRFTLDDIGNALEGLSSKFNWSNIFKIDLMHRALDIVQSEITRVFSTVNKALMLDQVDWINNMSLGWDKYGEKTQSVATIMAATGDSIDTVNTQMERLMFFTDETSYSFSDMANNIGKFTANGVSLKDSVSAMEGIANWAARSGQETEAASRVMYNLSQAIGMGALKLQDWKSVELANMGTKEFKEIAINAGLASHTLEQIGDRIVTAGKKTEVTTSNFRETLKEGWLDTETLMGTLTEYGKASDLISEIHDYTGLWTSELKDYIEGFRAGTMTFEKFSSELGVTGTQAEILYEKFKLLSSEGYEFSLQAYYAGQEARTFGQAMKSVSDAVSSGWMKTFELIFGQYDKAKEMWTDLSENLFSIFRDPIDERNGVLKEASISGWDRLTKSLTAAGVSMGDFDEALIKAGKIKGFDLQDLGEEYESFTDAVQKGAFGVEAGIELIKNAIDNLHGTSETVEEVTGSVSASYDEINKLGSQIAHWEWEFGENMDRSQVTEQLIAMGYTKEEAAAILAIQDERYRLGRYLTEEEMAQYLALENISTATGEIVELDEEWRKAQKELADKAYTEAATESFRSALIDTGHILVDIVALSREAFRDMFPPVTAERLYEFASSFKKASEAIRGFFEDTIEITHEDGTVEQVLKHAEAIDKIKQVLYVLLMPLRLVADIAGAIFKLIVPLGKLVLAAVEPIFSLVSGIAGLMFGTSEAARELDPFANAISKITDAIKVLLNFVTEVVKYVGGFVKDKLLEKLSGPITKLSERFNQFKSNKLKGLENFVNQIKALDPKQVGNKIIGFLSNLYHLIVSFKNGEANGIVEFFSGLFKNFGPVGSLLNSIIQKFEFFKKSVDLRSALLGETKFAAALNIIKFKASNAFETLKNKIFTTSEAGQALRERFDSIIATVAKVKDQVVAKLKEIKDAILNLVQGKEIDFGSIFGSFEEKKQAVVDFFNEKGITLPKILKGGALAVAAGGLLKFISTLKDAKEKFTFSGFVESLNPFSDAIEKVKTVTSSFNIVAFAIGMAILAGALIALSKVDVVSLGTSLGTLGIALAEFIGTLAAVNKVMGNKKILNFVGLGIGMMAIAGAMLLFAKAVNVFTNIDFKSGSQVLKTIALIGLAVISLSRLAKTAGKFNFKLRSGLGLMAAATSLWLFGKVLQSYTKLKLNKRNILKVLTALLLAVGTLGILAAIVGKSKFKLSNGLALMAMATSLLIFAGVVAIFGNMKDGVLKKGLINLALLASIVTIMTMLIGAMMSGSRFGTGVTTVLVLVGVTVALTTLALVVGLLGLIDANRLSNSLKILEGLAVIITAMTAVTAAIGRAIGLKKAIAGVILLGAVALAILAFGAILAVLSVAGWGMLPGMAFMGIIILEMAAVMAVISMFVKAVDIKSAILGVAAIGLFGLSLIPLVYVLKELGNIDYSGAAEGMNMLSYLLAGFLAVVLVAFVVGQAAAAAGPIFLVGMAVVGILFAGFILAIHQAITELERLSQLDAPGIMAALDAIDALIDEFCGIAAKFNANGMTFKTAVTTSAKMFAFGTGLHPLITDAQLLGLVDAEKVQPGIEAVDSLIDYMIGLRDKFINTGTTFGDALTVAAEVFAFGVGLYPLATDTRILGLANATAAQEAIAPMEQLIVLMTTLAGAIGSDPAMFNAAKTTAGVVAAFGIALLPLVAAELVSGFADAETVKSNMDTAISLIDKFVEVAEKIRGEGSQDDSFYTACEGTITVMEGFGKALSKLVLAEFIGSFINAQNASAAFENVKSIITFFLDTAQEFAVEGVDESSFKKAEDLAKACKQFGVALAFLTGASFIQQFINAEASEEGFKPIKSIIDFFIETAQKFGNGDGLVDFDTAKGAAQSCEEFGKALTKLSVAELISGLADAQAAEESLEVIKKMVGMFMTIAYTFNSKESMFESAQQAAEACGNFAKAISSLTKGEKKVSKLNATAANQGLESIRTTIEILISLAESFVKTEGMKQAAEDAATAVSTFSTKLREMARNLTDGAVGNTWSGIDTSKVTAVVDEIVSAMTSLAAIENVEGAVNSVGAIANFLNALLSLKTTNDVWGTQDFDVRKVTGAIDGIKVSITDLSSGISKFSGDNFIDFMSSLTNYANNESITAAIDSMSVLGNDIISSISDGMINASSMLSTALTTAMKNGTSAINGWKSSYYNAGYNVIIGFNNGLVSGAGTVYNNARTIANSVVNILKTAFKIKSPSRVFAEIGEYAMLGLAKGFEDSQYEPLNSIEILGDSIITAMQNAMAYASDANYGLTPTITPVVDMNNMAGQAASINSMIKGFNLNGISASANIDGATINNTIQSRDIINEIHLLNERMAVMDDNLKNMQLVLDTGALVGGTSARYDNQFGLMAMRKGRGN